MEAKEAAKEAASNTTKLTNSFEAAAGPAVAVRRTEEDPNCHKLWLVPLD